MIDATITIVDDDEGVREGLATLFSVGGLEVRLCDGGEALLADIPTGAGCIVLDMRLGGMDGQQVLEALRKRGCDQPVMILSGHGDIAMAVKAMNSGAQDFMTKPVDGARLVLRVGELLAIDDAARALNKKREAFDNAMESLTPREYDVLMLAGKGVDTRATAEHLGISIRTVEVYRTKIAHKFNATSIADIRLRAAELGVSLT